jgi:thymidylate synthase
MNHYLDMLRTILAEGEPKSDRTGTGTLAMFGYQFKHDLSLGFPLLTTKKIPLRLVTSELLWFIAGDTNLKYLHEQNNHIWDEWADERGDLGPIYGAQWRGWGPNCRDQLSEALHTIHTNPDSRRIIVTAWNPDEVPKMALPPCHMMFQFQVSNGKLSLHMYQRSADVFLGVPFNIASYAMLTHLIAHCTGLQPGKLIISFGDLHIYDNHRDQVMLQLTRAPLPLPKLILNPDVRDLFAFTVADIGLADYQSHRHIPAPVAV